VSTGVHGAASYTSAWRATFASRRWALRAEATGGARPTGYESRLGANSAGPREPNRAIWRRFRLMPVSGWYAVHRLPWHQLGTKSESEYWILQGRSPRAWTPGPPWRNLARLRHRPRSQPL